MKRAMLAVFVLASLLLMGMLAPGEQSKGIPDTEIGLSKASIFDTPAPEVTQKNVSEPGDLPLPPRGSPDEPPVIPHGVGEFLPITLAENQCADCHVEEEKIPGEPTPIPRSHYVDLRNAPKDVQNEIVGARYNCVACHVSPGGNTPLVTNSFGN